MSFVHLDVRTILDIQPAGQNHKYCGKLDLVINQTNSLKLIAPFPSWSISLINSCNEEEEFSSFQMVFLFPRIYMEGIATFHFTETHQFILRLSSLNLELRREIAELKRNKLKLKSIYLDFLSTIFFSKKKKLIEKYIPGIIFLHPLSTVDRGSPDCGLWMF